MAYCKRSLHPCMPISILKQPSESCILITSKEQKDINRRKCVLIILAVNLTLNLIRRFGRKVTRRYYYFALYSHHVAE
jgi:hypothetical protein